MNEEIFCTVFTPTYNRKELLNRLYNSLHSQENNDFEWIIVDDGSNDGTEEYVKELIEKEDKFRIIYKKQENGGKHRAINAGVELAKGNVFAIVDSDDYLTNNAIDLIKKKFKTIENSNDRFAGIAFQKGYNVSKPVGSTFQQNEYIDAKSNERKKYNIEGDKFEIFYTYILKENKFPEIEDEKFMTEALVWTRIAAKGYKIRWFNEIIYICEYLEGGLSDTRESLIKKSPKGYALYIKEQVKYGNISLKQKLGYYSFYCKCRIKDKKIVEIAKELNANVFCVYLSYNIRKIIEKIRG